MSIRLSDLYGCFEGVIPSIIASTSAEGTPNISYLSHVVMIDEDHIALSNQFFAKTSANIRANPHVTLLLVDSYTGQQYVLDILFERSVDDGDLFERIALQLKASSAKVGMSGIMRLRSADIFEVLSVRAVPSAVEISPVQGRRPASFAEVGAVAKAITAETEAGGVIDALLAGLYRNLRCEGAMILLNDADCGALTTVGSIGYETSGLGSEVHNKDDLIASAAIHGRSIKVSDMSRVRRFGQAIISETHRDENATRTIPFPRLADAMSQLAVPMVARGSVRGVVLVESRERMAFRDEDVTAIEMLSAQAANALALMETEAEDAPSGAEPVPQAGSTGRTVQIVHHTFDDSIFIDNDYVIKGVAGRLLAFLVGCHLREGRTEFSNREIRLAEHLRLPDLKDNLETRLILLRRRLEERGGPIQLAKPGRGQIRLECRAPIEVRTDG